MKKIILFLGLLFCCSKILAEPIKKIIFLGDSLSDNGNLYRYDFKIMPKDPPYFKGRFSNGPTWADYLAEDYQTKFNIASDNYAVGGATTVLRNPLKGCLPLDLREEIDDYLVHTVFKAKERADALFIIWIGANDYTSETQQEPHALVNEVVDEINANIEYLIAKGGKHFSLIDLPDLSKTARGIMNPDTAPRLSLLSQLHHQKMLDLFNHLKVKHPDLTFSYIDIYTIFSDVITNTAKYNQKYNVHIKNTTQSCWLGSYTVKKMMGTQKSDEDELAAELQITQKKNIDSHVLARYILNSPSLSEAYKVEKLQANGMMPCNDPDDYIFWDEIHPTTVMHKMLASIIEEAITHKEGE